MLVEVRFTNPPTTTTQANNGPNANVDMAALDVARIAVMVILQDSNELNDAIIAQQSLQNFFVSGGQSATNPAAVDIGNGYTVNLQDGQVTNPNGTIYGQRISS